MATKERYFVVSKIYNLLGKQFQSCPDDAYNIILSLEGISVYF